MKRLALTLVAFVAGFVVVRRGFLYFAPADSSIEQHAVVLKRPAAVPVEIHPAREDDTASVPSAESDKAPAHLVKEQPLEVDPQTELKPAIADLLARLRQGAYVESIRRYMQPSVLKSMSAEKLAELEKRFEDAGTPGTSGYEQMQRTIHMLEEAVQLEPEMNNVADIATFRIAVASPEAPGGQVTVPVRFVLEDGRWFLR